MIRISAPTVCFGLSLFLFIVSVSSLIASPPNCTYAGCPGGCRKAGGNCAKTDNNPCQGTEKGKACDCYKQVPDPNKPLKFTCNCTIGA